MTADQFTVSEKRLAEALGLSRATVKDVRANTLEKNSDWIYLDTGAVHFSRTGIERTLAHLGIPAEKIALLLPAPARQVASAPLADLPPSPSPDLPPNEPAALDLSAPNVEEVSVTRCFSMNKHIIAGVIGERPVRVRVKSSLKLRPGMVLRCTLESGDLYELAERLPRWPGKH